MSEPEPSGLELDLDDAHVGLARRLIEREQWTRAEVESICAELGLLASGAIETLNTAVFDLTDEPFLEGDDPLDVNTEFIAEFMHV